MDLIRTVKRALTVSCIVILGLAIIVGIIAGGVGGMRAAGGVIIGAVVSLAYSSLTGIGVIVGSKRDNFSLMIIVCGGWLAKLIVFFGIILLVKALNIVDLTWCFWALVGAAIIGLIVDATILLTSRTPYVDVLLPTENPEDE